jgi:hypothetical protein
MEMPLPDNTLPMMTGDGPFGSVEMGGMFTVLKVRRDQKPGDYRNPAWFKHPAGTVAYEFTGSLPAAARAADPGVGSMPAKAAANTARKDIEVRVRKPSSGHAGH